VNVSKFVTCLMQRPSNAPCSYFMPKFPVADQQSATFSLRGSFVSISCVFISLLVMHIIGHCCRGNYYQLVA